MIRLISLILVAVVAMHLGCATTSVPTSPEFKTVSFDEFFVRQVAVLPLSFEIPAQYVHAAGLSVPVTYSYWMRQEEVARAAQTQDLPAKTGYVYGKLSLNEGFDRTKGKFTTEDQYEAQLAQVGGRLIERKRFEVKGHPVLSVIVQMQNGTVVCSMWVATLFDTNALYIAYRPPGNDVALARAVWGHLLASLR